MNEKLALRLLDGVTNVLLNNQIKCFLIGGTLLGAVRNSDFISHDTDVDLAITYPLFSDAIKFRKFVEELDDTGFRCGSLWDMCMLSIWDCQDKQHHLDLVYCHKEHDYYKFTYNGGYYKYPEKYFNTLQQIDFKGRLTLIPNKSTELLELQFGKDWQTPINNKKATSEIDTKKKPQKVFTFPMKIVKY